MTTNTAAATATTATNILTMLRFGTPVSVAHIRNRVDGDWHGVLMALVAGGLVQIVQMGYPYAQMVQR